MVVAIGASFSSLLHSFFDQIVSFFRLIWDSIVLKLTVIVDIVVILYNAVVDIVVGVFGQYFRDLWYLLVRFWEGLVDYFTYHMRRRKKTLVLEDDECQEELLQCEYESFLGQIVPKIVAVSFLADGVLNDNDR